jgi:two-component system, NtrC family, sensor kinase
MYNLAHMTVSDMAQASTRLRKLGRGAHSMEEASQRMASFFFDELGAPDGQQRGCVLVRVYKTHRFGDLPSELQEFAAQVASGPLPAQAPCLALLGTVGVEPAWCARQRSNGHRAIPLPSVEAVARLPMVAQLVSQLGFDVASLITGANETLLDQNEQTFNVFYIPTALGSPFVPAQDFVSRYEVQSVLGCGGQLPDGELYAVIAFARTTISRETAELFKPLALAAKLALLPFLNATFNEGTRVGSAG